MVSTWAEHNAVQNTSWSLADGSIPPEKQLSQQAPHELADSALAGLGDTPPFFVPESLILHLAHGCGVGAVPVSSGAIIDEFRNGPRSAAGARLTIWNELFHYGLRELMTPEAYASAMTGLYNSAPTGKVFAQRLSVLFDVLARTREVAKSRGAPGANFTLKG